MRAELMTAANAVEDRTATQRADDLANVIEHACERLDELCARLGRERGKAGVPTNGTAPPRPSRPLLYALDEGTSAAQRLQDSLTFIEQRL